MDDPGAGAKVGSGVPWARPTGHQHAARLADRPLPRVFRDHIACLRRPHAALLKIRRRNRVGD